MAIADDRGQCFQINGVSWEQYEHILQTFADRRLPHSYLDGVLEFMSPSTDHDWTKSRIARLIEAATLELGIELLSSGSSTLRRSMMKAGLEPDEAYFIASVGALSDDEGYDPDRDPPPDLAVEVDVASSSLPRMSIYAALGVPEIWRIKDGLLSFLSRQSNGEYKAVESSIAIPLLRTEDIMHFLDIYRVGKETAWIRQFMAWIRERADESP